MTEYNNPQAFPEGSWEYDGQGNVLPFQHHGMTMLDYFAAKAMAQLINKPGHDMDDVADVSYRMADAMLKERAKWIK